jgi:hypothetical protein
VLVPVVNEYVTKTGMCIRIVRDGSQLSDVDQSPSVDGDDAAGGGVAVERISCGSDRPEELTSVAAEASRTSAGDQSTFSRQTNRGGLPVPCRRNRRLRGRAATASNEGPSQIKVSLREGVRQGIVSLIGRGKRRDLKIRRFSAIDRLTMRQTQRETSVYVCSVCHKTMRTAWGIRRHLVDNHADVVASGCNAWKKISGCANVHGKPCRDENSCRDCSGMSFDSRKSYQRHRRMYHSRQRCGLCQISLDGRAALRDHVMSYHPGTPVYKVPCSSCFGKSICRPVGGKKLCYFVVILFHVFVFLASFWCVGKSLCAFLVTGCTFVVLPMYTDV